MFDSRLDKAMCIVLLYVMGFVFAIRHGGDVFFPFAAVATLAFGMAVKPAAEKGEK